MGKLKILPISIRISERDLSVFTGVLDEANYLIVSFWKIPTFVTHRMRDTKFCLYCSFVLSLKWRKDPSWLN